VASAIPTFFPRTFTPGGVHLLVDLGGRPLARLTSWSYVNAPFARLRARRWAPPFPGSWGRRTGGSRPWSLLKGYGIFEAWITFFRVVPLQARRGVLPNSSRSPPGGRLGAHPVGLPKDAGPQVLPPNRTGRNRHPPRSRRIPPRQIHESFGRLINVGRPAPPLPFPPGLRGIQSREHLSAVPVRIRPPDLRPEWPQPTQP